MEPLETQLAGQQMAEAEPTRSDPAQPAPILVPALPPIARESQRPVADAKFVAVQALSWAMMVADYEVTVHKLADGRFYERNFLYGQNPTRARLYGIGVPVTGALTYLSYRMKKKGKAGWVALPVMHIGARGFAVGYNLSLNPK